MVVLKIHKQSISSINLEALTKSDTTMEPIFGSLLINEAFLDSWMLFSSNWWNVRSKLEWKQGNRIGDGIFQTLHSPKSKKVRAKRQHPRILIVVYVRTTFPFFNIISDLWVIFNHEYDENLSKTY